MGITELGENHEMDDIVEDIIGKVCADMRKLMHVLVTFLVQ